jgi:fused-like protein
MLMHFLMNISSKSDLGPTGFIKMLTFIHDAIQNEQKEFMQKIFKNCMKLLCSMMRDNQLLSVQEWPLKCGGGTETTQNLIIIILKIFNIPFNQQIYDREVDEISAGLAKADIIYLTLNALKYLSTESIPIGITLISRLVFSAESSKQFAQ